MFGKPLEEHLHPELWLRGYDSDKSATLNINAAEVIESWSNGDKEDESVYKTTRKGTIKRKVTTTTTTRKGTDKRKVAHTLSTPITKRVKGKHGTDGSESSSFNSKAYQNDHTCAIRRNRLKFVTVNLHYVSSVDKKFYMSMKKMKDFKKKTRH